MPPLFASERIIISTYVRKWAKKRKHPQYLSYDRGGGTDSEKVIKTTTGGQLYDMGSKISKYLNWQTKNPTRFLNIPTTFALAHTDVTLMSPASFFQGLSKKLLDCHSSSSSSSNASANGNGDPDPSSSLAPPPSTTSMSRHRRSAASTAQHSSVSQPHHSSSGDGQENKYLSEQQMLLDSSSIASGNNKAKLGKSPRLQASLQLAYV